MICVSGVEKKKQMADSSSVDGKNYSPLARDGLHHIMYCVIKIHFVRLIF